MKHYTYNIKNVLIDKRYIGRRQCEGQPNKDIGVKYFSSSQDKEFIQDQKDNPQNYTYEVLEEFNTLEEAAAHEEYLHKYYNVRANSKFYNRSNAASRFDATGMVPAIDIRTGKGTHIPKEEYYSNDNYKTFTKGKVVIHDKETGEKSRISRTEFISNDNFVGNTYGKAVALNIETGKILQVTKYELADNPKLVSIIKDKVNCKNIKTGENTQVSSTEFNTNPDLVGSCEGTVSAVSIKTGNSIKVTQNEFDTNPDLVGSTKGFLYAKDMRNNIKVRIPKEDYYSQEYYVLRRTPITQKEQRWLIKNT